MYGNPSSTNWLGGIRSSGVPHFNGTAVNYILSTGTTEATIFVGLFMFLVSFIAILY